MARSCRKGTPAARQIPFRICPDCPFSRERLHCIWTHEAQESCHCSVHIEITGRVPRDTQALALRLRKVLDTHGATANRQIVAQHLLLHLQPEKLTYAETMEVLEHLLRQGVLGRFLNHVSSPDLRRYLRNQDVHWEYIYSHWEANFQDSGAFFLGFLIGAAEA